MDRHFGRRKLLASAAALGAAALGGAAGPDPALVEAAKREGTLTYYHNSDIGPTARWNAAFTQAYGIPVKNVRMPSYALYDRWLKEERVGRHIGDLIQITDPTLLEAADKQGFIARYTPASAAGIDATLRQDGVWYGLYLDYMGIGYNVSKLQPGEEAFLHTAGWDALADPRWKGRIGSATPASGGTSYIYFYMFLNALKDRYGAPYLRRVAANKPDVYASKAPLFERLSAGEYAVMDQGTESSLSDFYLKGAPVRWVFPEPTPVGVTVQSVSAHAPHPNAARLFQEWSCSQAGVAGWLAQIAVGPTRSDVTDPRRAARKDWYGQPWFSEPKTLYTQYLKDPGFAGPKQPIIDAYNTIYGYQGG